MTERLGNARSLAIIKLTGLLIAGVLCGLTHSAASSIAEADSTPLHSDRQFESINTFLGLSYARAARWEPPEIVPFEEAQIKAQSGDFPPACMQTDHIVRWYRDLISDFGGDPSQLPAPAMDEDCLFLNIWAPKLNNEAPFPVVVYLHGGSNKGGWSFEPNYLGYELAQKGLVVVSVNYRLGIFGFFAHPTIPDPNFALQDQLAALRWIADNINQFGGDNSNITLMGESAGASNIDFILASPDSRGLVHKAIHHSAGWAINGRVDYRQMRELAETLTRQLTGEPSNIDALKSLDAHAILEAARVTYSGVFFDPIPNTPSLPTPAMSAFASRSITPVDLLIGSNADEWLMYLAKSDTLESVLADTVAPEKRPEVAALLSNYDEREAMDTLTTARNYVCPSFTIASAVRERGKSAWFYQFDRIREGELAAQMGAYHGAELPYVFNTHDDWLPTNDTDRQLTEAMMTYWAQFAKTGDPHSASLPVWPLFEAETKLTLRLDKNIRSTIHPSAELCSLLEK